MTDHPATDGTTERLPNLRDEIPRSWLKVVLPIGERDAEFSDILALIEKLDLSQALALTDVVLPESTARLRTALSAQQSAERELAKAMRVVEMARAYIEGNATMAAIQDALRALDAATEGGEGYSAAALAECDCEKWRDLNAENASLRDDIEELRPQLATAKSLVEGLEKLEEKLAAAEQHKADLRLHVDLAVKKCEMAEADRERLHECQVETQAKLELTERTNASLRQQCRDADERFLALLEERNAAQKKLAATEGGKTSACEWYDGPDDDGKSEHCGSGKPATFINCFLMPAAKVCEDHKCRCAQPPQTEGGESAEAPRPVMSTEAFAALENWKLYEKARAERDALRAQLAEAEKREAVMERDRDRYAEKVGAIAQKTAREQRLDIAIRFRFAQHKEEILAAPLVTDAPSKPEDESMRRNVIPCTCGGGRDTMCPEHGVMNGQDCPACGSWVYQWDSRERCPNPDCRRQFSPKDWGEEIPTCKHGAPNCTAEHE